MSAPRHAIKLFFGILFLSVSAPLLTLAIVLVTGIQTVVSPHFLPQIIYTLSQQAPELADATLITLAESNEITDDRGHAWLNATLTHPTKPSELMRSLQVDDWIVSEGNQLADHIRTALQSTQPLPAFKLNTEGLRQAIDTPQFRDYLTLLFDQLPSCQQDQLLDWQQFALDPQDNGDIPACRPPEIIKRGVVEYAAISHLNIDSEIELFPVYPLSPLAALYTWNILLSLGAFLPGLILLLSGAWLVAPQKEERLKIAGLVLIGSTLIALLGIWITIQAAPWLSLSQTFIESLNLSTHWPTGLSKLLVDTLSQVFIPALRLTWSKAAMVAGSSLVIGVLLVIISFMTQSKSRSKS